MLSDSLDLLNSGYGDPAAEPRPGGARDPTGIADLRVVGVGEEKERASPNGEAAAESSDGLLGIKVNVMLDWDSIRKLGPMTPLPDVIVITLEIYVEKSANGWASLMVRATELSIPAKRKTPPLVSICAKQVERVTKVAQNHEIIKSQVVIRVYFFLFTVVICGIIMIHPAGLREKLSSDIKTFTDVMKLFMTVVLYILQIVITLEIYVIENIVWIPWLWWVQSMMVKISIKFSFMKQFKKI
ncbi:BnaC04g43710D [Brassica napus]|uniref:BnaC04g43710D protein n=1 Tax=Brassica napus TaxID=3708 RepID=A0A078GEG9_BRANA|nr:BnaC04g43710D [Brassica napus]